MHGSFYGLDLKKEMVVLENSIARFVHDEEHGCRFEGRRKETWIFKRPAWSIDVRERMEFSGLTTQFINTLAMDVIQILDIRNYFYLAKVDSSLHVGSRSLSLSDSK